jgi:hypothetical protein
MRIRDFVAAFFEGVAVAVVFGVVVLGAVESGFLI